MGCQMINIECECGHNFRKKCKRFCDWEHPAISFVEMFPYDGYISDGIYVDDLYDIWEDDEGSYGDEFYDNNGRLLLKYGSGKCPKCHRKFWFEKQD